jgi:AcrR family transcriptional regulator
MPAGERKTQILKSSIPVFARDTYHGATTKSLAEAAGVTEALIYRYFGSKRELFLATIDHTSARIVRGLERVIEERRDDPPSCVEGCFEFYVGLLSEHDHFARMFFLVLSELDQEDIREVYLPHQRRALAMLQETLGQWQEVGFVPPGVSVESAAWLFFGSYLVLALVQHSRDALDVDAAKAIEMAKPFFGWDATARPPAHVDLEASA